MHQTRGLFLQSLLLIWLGLAYRLASAQSSSCPLITIDDLGSTTTFSSHGLVARGLIPPGETAFGSAKIRNFTKVCDAAGDRINTSSFVSVVVEFQCEFVSSLPLQPSLAVCSDRNNIVTRQYQFQCIEQNGVIVWETTVSNSNLFVQTLNPTATLSTPLADQCRRCIDDQQSSRADPTTHCDPCSSQCNQGQGRCFLGQAGDMCCNFYLQNSCTEECPSGLMANSNSICVCPSLSLDNGDVSYSPADRGIGSVATYTCNPGYQLTSPQAGMTRTCSENGWSDQSFTCEQRQPVICRASVNCAGGAGDNLGVAASRESCCLDNPAALAYSALGSEECIPCIVVGFLNASFSGVEQGPGHSVPVGYLKGGTIAGQNLVFNVESTPGTAREGSQFDYTVNTFRVRALANGQVSNVVLTFRVDSIALEPNETFILTLDPLVAPTPRTGLFFRNTITVTIIDSDSQSSGDLRLVARNGQTTSTLIAGRLEVYYNGQWGTVCDDQFGTTEAGVACRQLGFSAGSLYDTNVGFTSFATRFTQASSSTPIWLDSLSCNFSNSRLIDCASSIGVHDCIHAEDVVLFCQGDGAVRLISSFGSSSVSTSAGRVEVYYNGEWGTVCDDSFGQTDADVVCRQLGYPSASTYGSVRFLGYSQGSGTIWLTNLACSSSDLMLSTCTSSGFGNTSGCFHSEDVAVICNTLSSANETVLVTTVPSTTLSPTTVPAITVPLPQPPPPLEVQGLCSIVVWYSPVVQSCEDIRGYEVRLYSTSPQLSHPNMTNHIGANRTFYMVEEEKLPNSHETYVQVRVIHRTGQVGEWSEGISLGCEKPTVPEKPPRVHFELNGKIYLNNSALPLTDIGEGTSALYCRTDKEECCRTVPNRFGQFYYPNGVQVPIANRQQGFYRNRGNQIIRLNRREGTTSPTGTYRCEILNADDETVRIYITLTG